MKSSDIMSDQAVNETDFDSPGFEYLRSYQNTINLFYKLEALNYRDEFCSLYKCPPINKYYFSIPNENLIEQQFTFLCISAWLIKYKCQMNLQLEPEEYEDPDQTIETILEAIKLIRADYSSDAGLSSSKLVFNAWLGFPPSRLKQSYGPEIVWLMNILADRALDIQKAEHGSLKSSPSFQVIYRNEQSTNQDDYITICQPIVGGGLTTRPLGTYRINDQSLVFPGPEWDSLNSKQEAERLKQLCKPLVGPEAQEWYQSVKQASKELSDYGYEEIEDEDWNFYLESMQKIKSVIGSFLNDFKLPLQAISSRIRQQLKVIASKEKYIQVNGASEIEQYSTIWRQYSMQSKHNEQLELKVAKKMELFENFNEKIRKIRAEYDSRSKDLAEGRHLRELQLKIDKLNEEKSQFDLKIGLLLSVYATRQQEQD